ncbi:MAG: serine protease [Acholeplasma sp.]|nr:serine protease [Acholeplasma sp.]
MKLIVKLITSLVILAASIGVIYITYESILTNENEQQEVTVNNQFKLTKLSQVLITASDGIATNYGSGVIVREDIETYTLLTNYHTIIDMNNIQISDTFGQNYTPSLISFDQENDLALLSIDKQEHELYVVLLANSLDLNEEIISMGFPSQRFMVTSGTVLSISSQIRHDAYIDYGSSGGALLNSDYMLVGINKGMVLDSNNNYQYSVAINLETIKLFLGA